MNVGISTQDSNRKGIENAHNSTDLWAGKCTYDAFGVGHSSTSISARLTYKN